MVNVGHILRGWGKKLGVIPTTDAEAKLSELRLRSCLTCIHAKDSKVLQLLNGNAEHVEVKYCSLCTCPCEAKSLVVEETCPISKW